MEPRKTMRAGGIFLFLGPMIGTLYGMGRGDPVLWMFYGFGLGILLALMIWLWDRRR